MVAHVSRPQHGDRRRRVAHRVTPASERYRSRDRLEVSAPRRNRDRDRADRGRSRAARRAAPARAADYRFRDAGGAHCRSDVLDPRPRVMVLRPSGTRWTSVLVVFWFTTAGGGLLLLTLGH